MRQLEVARKGYTHGGKFHADDVFSTAFLKYINPEFQLERGYNPPEDYEGIVYDIGLGKFDHHQEDAEIRENGVPYAAFGLLFREYGHLVFEEELANRFDESFIQPLDHSDNTGSRNEIAEVISLFNPSWDSEKNGEEAFYEAVNMAYVILVNKINKMKSNKKAEGIVLLALEKAEDGIMYLDVGVPWKQVVIGKEIDFVIYPSDRGGFGAQAVPKDKDSNELRIPFPEEWRGKRDEELAQVSGIDGLRFCHNSGFLIACDTLEGTLEACHKVRKESESGSIGKI